MSLQLGAVPQAPQMALVLLEIIACAPCILLVDSYIFVHSLNTSAVNCCPCLGAVTAHLYFIDALSTMSEKNEKTA